MNTLLKDLSSLLKLPNDSKVQLKAISILNEILELMKKLEKKKLTECQPAVEDALYNHIINQRANSDICNRYIYYVYKYMFDFGLNSRLNEFITKFSSVISASKTSTNVKCTGLWILGKVCCKANYKSPQLIDLIHLLVKNIKNTSDILIKNECFGTLNRLLQLKLPNFYNQINEIIKIILKQEKFATTELKCKKNILKAFDSALFFLNQTSVNLQYDNFVSFLTKCFEDEDINIRNTAITIYINLHLDKVFDQSINLQKIVRKKPGEPLKNFLEILLYFGNLFISTKNDINLIPNLNVKISYIHILKNLFEKNMDFINSSESLITKIFDLLISYFQLNYVAFNSNNIINYKQNLINLNNPSQQVSLNSSINHYSNQNKLNSEIEELYRSYINSVYHSTYRRTLLKHIFKRLNDSQLDLDKMENLSISVGTSTTNIGTNGNSNNTALKENTNNKKREESNKEREKYTEFHVNSMLFSLIEFSENNFDQFEMTYKIFQDISHHLVVYLISSVKSFRQLINRVMINMAYFLPSWRIQILTLILNLTSVAHAEVAALKNTFIYFVDETSPEYKYALIIRNNLDLLKDISNCLGVVLSTFAHKNKGVTVDMSNAALSIAKNMIIGKFADEEDNPKSLSLREKTTKFNYSNSDADVHKEAGWSIIQGLSSMDHTWLTNNFKTLFQLWKYVFSDYCCIIEEEELNKPEYREALLSEFFIKKAALASLRKFILASKDFVNSQNFQSLVPKFLNNALLFLVPNDKKKVNFFFKTILKEKYKEAKYYLYDCYHSIPIKLYSSKLNQLLLPICDDITATDYSEFSVDFIFTNLNYFDTFMCEDIYSSNICNFVTSHTPPINLNSNNIFSIDNFNIEKFNIIHTERINLDVNSKLVDSSVNLISEIILESSLNVKNRQLIFKHFLTHMSEISMAMNPKQTDKQKIIKAINIVYTLNLILKKSAKRNIFIINDESIFASTKMIFDIGFKIDNNIIRRISAEGHSLLIKVSSNTQENLSYYINAIECKFKNESNIDSQHFINTFYMIANIFRNIQFNDIKIHIDVYMNFIISYFNRIEDMFNPFISQSIYIITEVLIKNNQIDHARKMIEVYKLNYLFINKDNQVFFRDMMMRNSLCEIKLMLILVLLGENIKQSEVDLIKLILNKYMIDEKYKSKKFKRNFLYFSKVILKENSNFKLKELVHGANFMQFLIDNVLSQVCKVNHNYNFSRYDLNFDKQFSIEILLFYLISMENKNIDIFKEFCEKLINCLNNSYYSIKYFYFNNFILKQIFSSSPPSSEDLLFDKNNEGNLSRVCSFIDFENRFYEDTHNSKVLLFDMIYGNFHFIKLSKLFLKIYFEKKYTNFIPILNLIKDLIQNQLVLYTKDSNAKNPTNMKADSLTMNPDDSKDKSNKNISLLTIRKLNKSMHINVKKFLIKSLKHCLYLSLTNLNTNNISNIKAQNAVMLLEFLNHFVNLSMLIISCEECWEIKVKGVELLLEIIIRFAKLKDNRTDDDSLLIQQYEAQIASCIKTIFTNSYSITAYFKGMMLLYQYLSIPITTDLNYIKKINNFVDLNVLNTGTSTSITNLSTTFSEKYEHLLICKKLNFFCKIYLSIRSNSLINLSKIKKNRNNLPQEFFYLINVTQSKISRWQVHYENLISPEFLNEFFASNFHTFFINLFNMLNDLYIILTQDRKFANNYKNYEFLSSGNRISYSHRKLLKYGQFYLKIFGKLVNDNKFMSEDIKHKIIVNGDNVNPLPNPQDSISNPITKSHPDFNFDHIFNLVYYYLNYFTIKKLQNENDYKLTEFVIYSEDDVTDELKEKIMLNSILANELLEVILNLVTNSSGIVEIKKNTFFEIFKNSINLFRLSIDEIEMKLWSIIECLIINWLPKLNSEITNEEFKYLVDNISKLLYFYSENKLYNDMKTEKVSENNLLKITEIIFWTVNYMITESSSNFTVQNEYLFYLFRILLKIFQEYNNQNFSKIIATKVFSLFNKIEKLEHLKLIIFLFKNALINLVSKFDRFFLIYYMILQYGSKNSNDIEISSFLTKYLVNDLFNINVNQVLDKEFSLNVFKSLMIGISQNFDFYLKILLDNLLISLIESNNLFNFFDKSEDLLNIILAYVLSNEDSDKRRMFITIIVLLINDNIKLLDMEMLRICVFLLKILSRDLDFLKDLTANMELGLINNLENLIKIQQAQAQAQAHAQAQAQALAQVKLTEKMEKLKGNENKSINLREATSYSDSITENKTEIEKKTSSGPKLKALKFSK